MDAVELLYDMVSIPSRSGEESALAAFLAERMAAIGLATHIDEAGNVVGVLGTGPRELILLGHLDTVAGGPAVELRDGKLFGRGTVDAKGPLATFVMAMATLGAVPGWRIVVIGAVEEEAASSKGARHVACHYRPDACVIGEPSGWDGLTLGYKGRLALAASLCRPSAHGAGPEPSAAEHLVDFWNSARELAQRFNSGRDRIFDQLQYRLEEIVSGSNGDTDTARASLGWRLPPGLDPEDLLSELKNICKNLCGPKIEFDPSPWVPAFVADRGSPLARVLQRAIRDTGTRPRLKVKTGTSDMNVVAPVWSCPILAYGPGDSRLDHTPREHVTVNDYLKAIGILREAVCYFSSR